jgi:hypothetical protein
MHTTTARRDEDLDPPVARWVRLGIVAALAMPQLIIGVWAVLAPRNWFESFPGIDPRLIAAEPPFNAHLATDTGAGFLAMGIALTVAALWGRRSGIGVALIAYVSFTTPHVLYHALNSAPGLSGVENVLNVALLASGLVWAAVFARGLRG